MKKIKRLVAIALAAVMVFALGSVAMAATTPLENGTSPSDTGSITINDLEAGVTATAYQIAKATYDSDGNFLGYEMTVTTSENGFKINADGSYDETTLTEANLAALYAATQSGTITSRSTTAGEDGTATLEGLPVGSYLIVITGSTGDEATAYGMMIGSVYYTASDGSWAIVDGEITDVENCELWAKATTPKVTKTEKGGSANEDTHGESANAGDEITFDITVSPIPSYQGEHPEFYVDDTLTGLTITDAELASITVSVINLATGDSVTLVKDTDYTITKVSDKEEFIVDFVVNGAYTLNEYAGETYAVVIEYQATVLDTEAYEKGESEHDNDAVLHYATTSYTAGYDGNPPEGTDEDKDYEYTFTLNAGKTDKDENALEGATFGLFTDSDCTNAYTQTQSDGTKKAVTATSDAEGILSFSGLEEGTYYMKETEAPAGYLLNTAVYKVVISATYDEDGSITSWSIVITDKDGNTVGSATQSADTGLTIINTKTGLLPSTGGRGTLIFTIIGCAIVACAVIGVVATRRRRAA